MHRMITSALACAVSALTASSAFAVEIQKHDSRAGIRANMIGGASAPNAQLAAVIDPDLGVVRSKGVAAVAHTQRGIYCIKPVAGINARTVVPVVSVDFSGSSTNNALVQIRDVPRNCASDRIEVITLADPNGTGFFNTSNLAGFSIVVP